jgi:hypothetical protein
MDDNNVSGHEFVHLLQDLLIWRKYALEAIIILLLSYFLFMIMFIFYARIVLSRNINTCVVYEQHLVPSMPLLV